MNAKKLIATAATMLAVLSLGSPAWAATVRKPVPIADTPRNLCYGRENLAAVSFSSTIQNGVAWLQPDSTWTWKHAVIAVPWDYVMCTASGPAVVSSLTQPFTVHWTVKNLAAHQPVLVALLAGSQGGNGFGKVWAHAHWTRILPGHTAKLTETTDYEQSYIDNFFLAVRLTIVPKLYSGYTMWVNDNLPFNVVLKHGVKP